MQNITAADFYKKSEYNIDTKNQLWCSTIADGHDNFCSCNFPFAHLLSSIFPPGHSDRDLTITQILTRDYTELCLSGGTEERNGGGEAEGANGTGQDTKREPDAEEEDKDIEKLLAAFEDAEGR